MAQKRPPLEVLVAEVNHHLPEGLHLRPPFTKKAIRYARSCLAFTYQLDDKDSARFLGPLNAALDQIELSLDNQTVPPSSSSSSSSSHQPPPKPSAPPPPSASPPKSPSAQTPPSPPTSTSTSTPDERWRIPRDDETPAERAFREALEEVERKNREQRAARTAQSAAFVAADAARARAALDVVDRYFHGDVVVTDTAEARALFELRKALLTTLEQRKRDAVG